MKTKLLLIIFLIPTVLLCNGFMVREKEGDTDFSGDYYQLQRNTCFASFISNLQKMEALIYIPKDKLQEAQKINLIAIPANQSISTNKKFAIERAEYVQVYPINDLSDECKKAISMNFKNLGMVCFVRKEKVTDLKDYVVGKFYPGSNFHKSESISVNTTKTEELQIKLNDSNDWQNFVPMMNKATR